MRLTLRTSTVSLGLAALVGALAACSKEQKAVPGAAGEPAASTAPAAPGPAGGPKTCTASPEKVWAANASVSAGITKVELDAGRVAFGVVLGGKPDVVAFDPKGEGSAVHVAVKKALTEVLPKDQARREILRVTPALGSGSEVMAFVDYRKLSTDHRLVACGPSDSEDELLKFDGKPLVAVDEDRLDAKAADKAEPPAAPPGAKSATPAPKAPPAEKAPAAAPPKKAEPGKSPAQAAAPGARRPPMLRSVDPAQAEAMRKAREAAAARAAAALAKAAPAPSASAAKGEPAKAEPKEPAKADTSKPKGDKVRELRDCRTFVDRGGAHAWTVGSELVGQPRDDGSTAWTMELFAEQEHGRGKATLSQSPLGKAPTKLPVYEAPTALDLGGGAFVLSARYRGGLFAWLLDGSKHLRGPARAYPGAAPWAPALALLGPDAALLIVQHDGERHAPRFAEFATGATELPSGLVDFDVGEPALLGTPAAVLAGEQRFVSGVADDAARRLVLVPVNGAFAKAGEPLAIDAGVHDSELVALADGRLLLVYLRGGSSGRMELVSRTVQCG